MSVEKPLYLDTPLALRMTRACLRPCVVWVDSVYPTESGPGRLMERVARLALAPLVPGMRMTGPVVHVPYGSLSGVHVASRFANAGAGEEDSGEYVHTGWPILFDGSRERVGVGRYLALRWDTVAGKSRRGCRCPCREAPCLPDPG